MKSLALAIFLVFTISICAAQQITFQGKLYQNNAPITGSGNFQFLINNGGINWSETQNGIPVNNGLYAVVLGSVTPMPLDLFKTSQSIGMQVLYNGTLIDNVTLHAPFERDYTVPDNIKDGISWGEVSNKPALDTSLTNELQTLSINGNTLSISQGNSVALPIGGGGVGNTVVGSFTVFDTTATTMPGVGQTGNCTQNSFSNTIWQSFLCTSSGKLRYIRLLLGSITANGAVINIYSGVGVSQALAGPLVINGITGGASYRNLDVSSLNLSLNSGTIYTFSIAPSAGGAQLVAGWNTIAGDPYQNGQSSIGATNDLCFEIMIDHTSPSSLTILNNGYVGISNSNPTSQLSVAGRIEDVTGFVTPVGSITAYGGGNEPKGWLICDGRSVSRAQYADLFNAIGTRWGSADAYSFNLPDLRGMFLRGVDNSPNTVPSGRDPNSGASSNNGADGNRYQSKPGGATGNNVGSIQNDEFKSHDHFQFYTTYQTYYAPGNNVVSSPVAHANVSSYPGTSADMNYLINPHGTAGTRANAYPGSFSGGGESRPKNVYVYYIIKY